MHRRLYHRPDARTVLPPGGAWWSNRKEVKGGPDFLTTVIQLTLFIHLLPRKVASGTGKPSLSPPPHTPFSQTIITCTLRTVDRVHTIVHFLCDAHKSKYCISLFGDLPCLRCLFLYLRHSGCSAARTSTLKCTLMRIIFSHTTQCNPMRVLSQPLFSFITAPIIFARTKCNEMPIQLNGASAILITLFHSKYLTNHSIKCSQRARLVAILTT